MLILLFGSIRQQLAEWELKSLTFRQLSFAYPPQNRTSKAPIALVTYEQKTKANDTYNRLFGGPYSMSRSALAHLIRFFKKSAAKYVVLDVSFNGGNHYKDPAGDQELVKSLQHTDCFASDLLFNSGGLKEQTFENQPPGTRAVLEKNTIQVQGLRERFPHFYFYQRFPSLIPPFPALMEKTPMHFFSAQQSVRICDVQNVKTENEFQREFRDERFKKNISRESRCWSPFTVYGNRIFPTLALGAVLKGEKKLSISPQGRLSWQTGSINLGNTGLPLVKWYHHGTLLNHGVYPEYSFWDLIESEIRLECLEKPAKPVCKEAWTRQQPVIRPEAFNNKYVLIGLVTEEYKDLHNAIYSEPYPGVYIFANMLDNVLNDDFVYRVPEWVNWLALMGLPALMLASILYFRSVWINTLLLLTLGYGYYVLCFIAYNDWNRWLNLTYPLEALVVCYLGMYIYRYFTEQKKRQQLRFAFGKYVSPGVMQMIERNPEKLTLGGERREMTFLFCDIRGFTTFSDHNPPEAVQAMLTQYFSLMNRIILHEYHGSINKLIGDAIMAYWGFPLENEDHAFLAVSAALRMREAIHEWRQDSEHPPIDIGIGLNTGDAMIGNVGSEDFMDFTVIGDAVNVASRLESANKDYGTNIIISAATYEKVKDRISARSLGWTNIRGKAGQVEVFEPLALRTELPSE